MLLKEQNFGVEIEAAIYARVSTAQQAEHGYSLETQIKVREKIDLVKCVICEF